MKLLVFIAVAIAAFSLSAVEFDDAAIVNRGFSTGTGVTTADYCSKPARNEVDNFLEKQWDKPRLLVALAEVDTGCDDVLLAKVQGEQINAGIVRIVTAAEPAGFWIESDCVRPLLPDQSGRLRYLVGPYLSDGWLIHQKYVMEKRPKLWAYLNKHKERLTARKDVEHWYGVRKFQPIQKWIPLEDALKAKPERKSGVLLFYGLIAELPPDYRFIERDPDLQKLTLVKRFAGSVNGGIFIMDYALNGAAPVLIERIALNSESTFCSNRDFENYYRDFIGAAKAFFTAYAKNGDASREQKQLLLALSNVIKIGSMNN